ncbi:MAG: methyltransferase [Fusobacteria bacterium]|nr:methyltransferase [Fusobacteriota bacterium]
MIEIHDDETLDTLNKVNKKIIQKKYGFRFAIDAVLIANFLELKNIKTILDIGTGTGIIPLLLSEEKNINKIYGVEIQENIANMALRSIKLNNLSEKIEIINSDIKDIDKNISVDLIVSNPPYMKLDEGKISENHEKAISRYELKLNFEEFVKSSKRLLKSGGSLNIIHRLKRFEHVITTLTMNNFNIKRLRFIYSKEGKDAILFMVEAIKDRKTSISIKEPIYLYNKQFSNYEEIENYYK